jgi:DNA-binding HxlR family transcriptional regulator
MAIPTPGKPVRGSKSGTPIMAAFDLLGRRWALGIIWNLSRGPQTFRGLQSACETISPSILNSRIKELKQALIVDRSLEGYHLTPLGEELFEILKPFGEWSINWAKIVAPEDTDRWEKCGDDIEKSSKK